MSPFRYICPCPLLFPSLSPRSPNPSPAPNAADSGSEVPDLDAVPVNRARATTYPPTSVNQMNPQQSTSHTAERMRALPLATSTVDPPHMVPPVAEQPAYPKLPSNQTGSIQTHLLLAPLNAPDALGPPSHESLDSQHLTQSSNQRLPLSQRVGRDMLSETDIFSLKENFVAAGVDSETYNTTPEDFMEGLLKGAIQGAAFDSSARNPPPRCHPGTRLAILERCVSFAKYSGQKKIRLVVGPAGVGKSAIMQSIAESPDLKESSCVSVFFSVFGRNDGNKAVLTISYQLAAKSKVYRRLIASEIARDSSLLQSKMSVQFEKLIVKPFVHHLHLKSVDRVLIIIDGLDECNDLASQIDLLLLISDFCVAYPSSPIVWFIASRPEQHITSFFSQHHVIQAHEKEEILVDSDEARADVERYLRDGLKKIQEESDTLGPERSAKLDPEWPGEPVLWKLANASGGLFAYADAALRYIGDPSIKRPVEQLSVVLEVIDQNPMANLPPESHPMARLDALYKRILSKIPPRGKVGKDSRILLLVLVSNWDWALYSGTSSFLFLCNWLGMAAEDAYAAFNPLYSVFHIPRRQQAHKEEPRPFHKSIIDYLSDFNRSKFSRDIKNEAQKQRGQCALRISKQAPHGVDFGDVDYEFHYGTLARRPGAVDSISLTWRADGKVQGDNELKLMVYKTAIGQIVAGIEHREQGFQNEFCIRLLITRFQSYNSAFPFDRLRDLVFDEQRRGECVKSGILKEVPLKAISGDVIKVKFRFRRPASPTVTSLPTWKLSCNEVHEQEHELEEDMDEDWTTNLWRDCPSCLKRLEKQRKALSPDYAVPILVTSTGDCCVELDFVDPQDGVSKWTYWFWISPSPEECKKYGSIV